MHKVQEDLDLLKQMLASVVSDLQRNTTLASKLKADTDKVSYIYCTRSKKGYEQIIIIAARNNCDSYRQLKLSTSPRD